MQTLGLGLGPNFAKYSFALVRTDRCLVFWIVLAVVICIPEAVGYSVRYSATRGRSYSLKS